MPSVWSPIDAKLFIQPGGPGNAWRYTHPEVDVESIAGGDVSFASDYARGKYIGSRLTSNPGDYTGTVLARHYNTRSNLRDLAKNNCFFGMLLVSGCPELDITQFNGALNLVDAAFTTTFNSSSKAIDSMDRTNDKFNDSLPFRAAALMELRPLAHSAITGGVNAEINHVIGVGNERCAGPCGTENDGNQEYIAVGAPVAPATIPRIYYTSDGGATWKSATLTGITDGVAVRVTRDGDRILIAVTGTSAGLWAVSYATLKDPATTTTIAATLVSGISSGTTVNDVLAVGNLIFAVGASGTIWRSIDRGYSFSVLNNTATTENLTRIAAQTEDTVYFGGENGALLAYLNQAAITALNPSAIAGDDVTAIAVPDRWTDEVYIGTSTGEVWRSRDSRVSWSQVRFTGDNTGEIADLQFAGVMGTLLFILQNNATPLGRILVDRSGGAGGAAAQVLGSFSSPTNAGLNSIAPTDVNFALVVGAVVSSVGYIGKVHG
jgi:hypothetical protein